MGNRIKEYRKGLKMSQQELSEKSGISRTTISMLETGKQANTTSNVLLKIANAMGATVDEIFFR